MRRRDFFGSLLGAGVGLALVSAPRAAHAGPTLASGKKLTVKAIQKDGKIYLQPSATVALKPGQEIKFEYVPEFGEKKVPAFKLVEVKAGSGSSAIDTTIQGAPSPAFAKAPANILVISAGKPKGEPIVVEQPGS